MHICYRSAALYFVGLLTVGVGGNGGSLRLLLVPETISLVSLSHLALKAGFVSGLTETCDAMFG